MERKVSYLEGQLYGGLTVRGVNAVILQSRCESYSIILE